MHNWEESLQDDPIEPQKKHKTERSQQLNLRYCIRRFRTPKEHLRKDEYYSYFQKNEMGQRNNLGADWPANVTMCRRPAGV